MRRLSIYIILIGCINGFAHAQHHTIKTGSSLYLEAITVPSEKSAGSFYISRIINYFPEQLTDPEAKKRHSYAQFGYIFPISEFIEPGHFGQHSYGRPHRTEKNGSLYTCQSGFIDFSHLRAALDWTVYLTFKILAEEKDFELPPESGTLELHFTNVDKLDIDDISSMAQRIAFERLAWHEVVSWHHHWPNHIMSEQLSAFTPEDIYSNSLGAVIGKNVALRILNNVEVLSYSEVATEEIKKYILSLEPLNDKQGTIKAYNIVDLTRQQRLPQGEQNHDVWWESRIIFRDQRYIFKRYMNIGPELEPWLVPNANTIGCETHEKTKILTVPQQTKSGESFYNYYNFIITPDKKMFTDKGPIKHHHSGFEKFDTRDFEKVINVVSKEMEAILLPGFARRNNTAPSIVKKIK